MPQLFAAFLSYLWNRSTSDAAKLGTQYIYDEEGTLIAELGAGGAASSGTANYIYLPTASGPLPVVADLNGSRYSIFADHLNTPRVLMRSTLGTAWQWRYSAFGDEAPTTIGGRFAEGAAVEAPTFNLRYPGQYFDRESGLHYNGFRTYSPSTGRYTQTDPIGLDGGWNRLGYVGGNPLAFTDPNGLNPLAGAINGGRLGAAVGSSFGPPGSLIGGVLGAGAGAAVGWWLTGPALSDGEAPPRGLPPEGIKPPIPDGGQCKPGSPSRPSERDKGGQSLWDPNGGEWRWFPGDKWHNPHWDHNPHNRPSSPWVNVPHGDLPPVK